MHGTNVKNFLSFPHISHICLGNRIKSRSQVEGLKYENENRYRCDSVVTSIK